MDYDHLVGKECLHEPSDTKVFVAEIDDEVGITLHYCEDRKEAAMCLCHPRIFAQRLGVPREQVTPKNDEVFDYQFAHWLKAIEAGVFTEQWEMERANISGASHPIFANYQGDSDDICAFR